MPKNSQATGTAKEISQTWQENENVEPGASEREGGRIHWDNCAIDLGDADTVESGVDDRKDASLVERAMARPEGPKGTAAKSTQENAASADSGDAQAANGKPANDLANAIMGRLVIDDSDPFFIATLEGYILHTNELYDELSRRSGGILPPGPGQGPSQGSGKSGEVPLPMKVAFEEAEVLGRTVRYDERVVIGTEERCLTAKYLPVFDQNQDVIAVVASFRDVTAQQKQLETVNEAQNRFRDFARATSDWFWEVDKSLRVTALTDRFTALTGEPAVRALGRRLDELGQFKSLPGADEGMYHAIARRVSFRDELLEIKSMEGEIRHFHLSGVPVFDRASGEFSGYRGAGMDVTERLQQEEEAGRIHANLEATLRELTSKNTQLDIASAQAESALKTKNEFLASMSHELRTPLNAIIGFAEAMKVQVFGPLNEQYTGYSSDIMNSGRHLLGLIEDILDVAVMENGELSMTPEDVSLQELLDQTTALSMFRAEDKDLDLSGLKIVTNAVVHVDRRRATQVFANLLVNALKFTPDGGKVGFDVQTTREGRVHVSVVDTGIGIPTNKHAIIFEKFRQVNDNVYERSVEGSGLGLHISRELARRMGGELSVESSPGKGSRFLVDLPLVAAKPVPFPGQFSSSNATG